METRTLQIRSCGTNRKLREYTGRYSERYEAMPPDNAAHGTSYIAVRIGKVYDDVKGRVAVFRQPVQRLHAPRPTHLWVNEQWRGQSGYVGEAYSFDPGCMKIAEDGGERGERCAVWELIERAPTLEESPDVQAEPTAPATVAKLAARLDTVLKVSGMDGKPTRGQMIVEEVRKRQRNGMEPIDVCREIAREDFTTACKTGAGRWLRKAKALAVNRAYVRGEEPSKADVERLAKTLKRERNRALEIAAPKAKRARPRK